MTLNNLEGYLELYDVSDFLREGAAVFSPIHDVFGGQSAELEPGVNLVSLFV